MDGLGIAASLADVRRAVEGAAIRAVYEPEPGVFLLRVYGTRECSLLISPRGADLHLTLRAFRNPERPSSFVMQLRKHLRNGRIRAVRQPGWERAVLIDVVRQEGGDRHDATLIAELTGLRGNLLVLVDGMVVGSLRQDPRNPIGRPYEPMAAQAKADPRSVSIEELERVVASEHAARALALGVDGIGRQTAEDLVASAGTEGDQKERARRLADALRGVLACTENPRAHVDLERRGATFYEPPHPARTMATFGEALDAVAESSGPDGTSESRPERERILRAIGRSARTAEALRDWLNKAEEAGELRRRADFLLIHAPDLGRGTTRAGGEDPAGGEPLSFALSPKRNGIENAQDFYRKARKLDRGRPRVEARLRRLEAELERWEAALERIDSGREADAPAPSAAPAPRTAPAASAPRRFDIDGHVVLVGRNAAQNDLLMREARPHDLWLHARDVPGSHVVIRREGQAEVPARVLAEAAKLAARYSKADRRGRVAVVYAEARHVRKPRRGAPGLAIVTHDSTLTVQVEETP